MRTNLSTACAIHGDPEIATATKGVAHIEDSRARVKALVTVPGTTGGFA